MVLAGSTSLVPQLLALGRGMVWYLLVVPALLYSSTVRGRDDPW